MGAKKTARQPLRIHSALNIILLRDEFVWRRLEGTRDALTQDLRKSLKDTNWS